MRREELVNVAIRNGEVRSMKDFFFFVNEILFDKTDLCAVLAQRKKTNKRMKPEVLAKVVADQMIHYLTKRASYLCDRGRSNSTRARDDYVARKIFIN